MINLADKLTAKTVEGILADSQEIKYTKEMGAAAKAETVASELSKMTDSMVELSGDVVYHEAAAETVKDIDDTFLEIFSQNESARQTNYESKEAERDAEFASKEAQRDEATAIIQQEVETLNALSGSVTSLSQEFETTQSDIEQLLNKAEQYTDRFVDNPIANSENSGLMSADDKTKLDSYPSQFVLDLGLVNSQTVGEQMAARSEVAGNRNISFIRFQVQGVSTLKTTLIMQLPNGINQTAQIMCVDKAQWRRNVTGASGVKGATTTAYDWERIAPQRIVYNASNRKIRLEDYEHLLVSDVELPIATPTQHGLLSAADKTKLENYPETPLGISIATDDSPGLMSSADYKDLHNTKALAAGNQTKITDLEEKSNEQEERIGVLESFHAPSDMVEMTIKNDKAQRNVLFFKIEWIKDLEIDGRKIDTHGLSGKFYRSLSVGEHKVRFHVNWVVEGNRGLLGWADDTEAGYVSNVTRIVIPEGWTELPANCFERRLKLEEIVLPSTLKTVGGNCFQSLPALRELIIPKSVTTIKWSAINDCASLKCVRMGGNESMPLSLSYEAIRNCPALTCVEFLPCQLTFKDKPTNSNISPFQNLPQLNALICHMTEVPTFEPSTPFGTIGSGTTERKVLYRPAGVSFYDEGAWLNNLRNGLGFYVADL